MKPKRVLIADDDPMFARVLAMRCRFLGLEVRTCPDAMFALTLIHKEPPDLVILDIAMPAGNGLAVCEMMASDQRLSGIPVIIVTGNSDEETRYRCQQLHAEYFQKSPNVWDWMKPVVCRLLGIDPAEAARAEAQFRSAATGQRR